MGGGLPEGVGAPRKEPAPMRVCGPLERGVRGGFPFSKGDFPRERGIPPLKGGFPP